MAIELPIMKAATEKYRITDITGNYADMARAFGGYGERVTEPDEIVPAIKRGIEQTHEGTPALLEPGSVARTLEIYDDDLRGRPAEPRFLGHSLA